MHKIAAALFTGTVPRSRGRFTLPLVGMLLAFTAPALRAEPGDPTTDKFSFSLGGFLLNTKTTLRADGALGGTEIDTERDLGLQDSDRFRFDGYWRITPRQKLRAMYFNTSNNASKTLVRDITFNDQIYTVGLDIRARSKTQVTEIAWEYDFLRNDNYELGFTAGIHNLKFETGISIEANQQTTARDSSSEANGPLPVLGLRGVWLIGKKFYFDAGIQYFQISFDPYDGSLTDYTAAFSWRATEHFAFGAGWNQFVTNVEVNGDHFDGELKWRYGGARLFVTYSL